MHKKQVTNDDRQPVQLESALNILSARASGSAVTDIASSIVIECTAGIDPELIRSQRLDTGISLTLAESSFRRRIWMDMAGLLDGEEPSGGNLDQILR